MPRVGPRAGTYLRGTVLYVAPTRSLEDGGRDIPPGHAEWDPWEALTVEWDARDDKPAVRTKVSVEGGMDGVADVWKVRGRSKAECLS